MNIIVNIFSFRQYYCDYVLSNIHHQLFPRTPLWTFSNVTDSIANTARTRSLAPEISQALDDAIPMFTNIASGLGVNIETV